mmetsp:Transcript_51813/g.133597  ORF Transcript_51813/g.133597 Transcript_51813/m.133597 type:complete len:202 (-) Transcript_51813:173-778(-)
MRMPKLALLVWERDAGVGSDISSSSSPAAVETALELDQGEPLLSSGSSWLAPAQRSRTLSRLLPQSFPSVAIRWMAGPGSNSAAYPGSRSGSDLFSVAILWNFGPESTSLSMTTLSTRSDVPASVCRARLCRLETPLFSRLGVMGTMVGSSVVRDALRGEGRFLFATHTNPATTSDAVPASTAAEAAWLWRVPGELSLGAE